MSSSEEIRSLIEWFERNPVHAAGVLTRCAAGLGIIGVIALFGMESDLSGDAVSARSHTYRPLDASLSNAQSLYMARQQQFMSSQSATGIIVPVAQANPRTTDAWDRREE